MQNKNFKNLIKVSAIGIAVIGGLFAFSRGAEAAFSCDSGSTSTTCYVNTSKTLSTGETVSNGGAGSLVIQSGGILTSANSSNPFYLDFNGGDITLTGTGTITGSFNSTSTNFNIASSTASINVNGKGSAGGAGGSSSAGSDGSGTGKGGGGAYDDADDDAYNGGGGGGGGSYGGNSGAGGAGIAGAAGSNNIAYGSSTSPIDLGSGGGGGGSFTSYSPGTGPGGAGGGAIKIIASGTVTINGNITADGNNGGNGSFYHGGGGGGSGGSIWIRANTITGNASIIANGGSGGAGSYGNVKNYSGGGGGGGGGRVAVYYSTNSYTGSVVATGGANAAASGSYGQSVAGGAGTISIVAVSSLTAICSVGGNGCTSAGQSANPQEAYRVNLIAGTATSTLETYSASTQKVEISIYASSTNKWWNGNSFASTTENWIQATGTSTWSYDTPGITWTLNNTYQIRSRAYNAYGVVESSPQSLNFTYTNSPPTISNLTISNTATTTVTVNYGVTDAESGILAWVNLYYKTGATSTGALTSTSTSVITVSNASFFPLSGTILIDDEVITYTSKTGNDLGGTITRGAATSTASTHGAGAIVWIKAISATGNVGNNIATSTGYLINWDSKTDVNGFYSTGTQVKVVANDGAISNMIGASSSAAFVLDADNPTLSSATILINNSASSVNSTSSAITLSLQNISGDSSSETLYIEFASSSTWYGANSNGTLTAGSLGTGITVASSTTLSWPWTLNARTETITARIRDAYGNQATSTDTNSAGWNNTPDFQSTITAWQVATTTGADWGKVKIRYSIRDTDANYGSSTPNYITPTFQYNIGGGWQTITTSTVYLAATDWDNKLVATSSYTEYTATWNASSSIGNTYYATTQVRVVINDNETILNTASSTSAAFALDAKKPTNGGITFDAGVAGTTNGATITIAFPGDDNAVQYFITDDSVTHSSPTSTGWTNIFANATSSWTFDSDIEAKILKFQFRDVYGNTTATTTVTTAVPPSGDSFLVQDVSKTSTNDWKLYISWQTSTSTSFASYKLEYATSSDNVNYLNPYVDVTVITASSTNYYVHGSLSSSTYYRYRVGVKDTNNNISVRSNAYINAKPDGVQNLGEGGGGSVATAAKVENVVPTQGADGNVTVNYKLTDSSLSSKTSPSPSYEAYVLYDVGATLTSSSTNTLILSDTTKLPSFGFIQINQEVIGYTSNATSTGTLSGIIRETWPAYVSSGRTTRVNTTMASSTSVWIFATSTGAAITNTSIATGQTGSLTWNTANDVNLAGLYLTNVGIRVLVHDNQVASSGPISSQSDQSVDSTLAVLDKKAPVLGASSLLINGSSSSVENAGATAALSLTGVSGDTTSETIYIQFSTSTPATWRGANANGTINMTAGSWGEAASVGGNLGPWTWPLSGRSETVSVRIKDAYGNISNSDTNSIIKNAVPEFNSSSISDSDPLGYATTSNSKVVIRQCNVFDTDANCAAGKVKIKLQVKDPDANEGTAFGRTAGQPAYIKNSFEYSLNGGTSYSALNLSATYSATGTNALAQDAQTGTSTADIQNANSAGNYAPAWTTVVGYFTPPAAGNIRVRVSATDNEPGTAAVTAESNTITYDNSAPTTSAVTFDGGVAGGAGADRGTITVPTPADATTTQYMFSATTTAGTLAVWGWTTYGAASTTAWGFDSAVDAKSVSFRYKDIYGNATGTSTAYALVPPLGSSITIEDTSTSTSPRLFLSWPASSAGDFANYRVEYATSSNGTDYGSYSELALITNLNVNYFTHSGLNNTLYYRYRISVKNAAGNYSVKSMKNGNPYVTGKPDQIRNGDEAYANDVTPPTVTSVTSGSPQVTSVTISLNMSDAESLNMSAAVYYTAAADYNSSASGRAKYAFKFGQSGYVTAASLGTATTSSITLAGLAKNTEYRYAAEVCDTTGNCTFKEPATGNPYYSFTTADGPVIVNNSGTQCATCVTATPSSNSASLAWLTDKQSDSIIFYATSTQSGALVNPVTAGSNSQVTTADANGRYPHTVTIGNLPVASTPTTYYYKARSTDANGQYGESAIISFNTAAQSPPTITTAASCQTTDSTAIVSWATDQNTTTELSMIVSDVPANYFSTVPGAQIAQYPAGTIDNATRALADYTASHSYTFTGLSEQTIYYVKVRSLNATGGEVYAMLTCTTQAKQVVTVGRPAETKDTTPPLISAVAIKDISATTAVIVWNTDEPADSLVKYGTTMSYGAINGTEELSDNHAVTLSGLKPGAAYNFKITSADAKGNRAYAGDQSFTTLSLAEAAQTTKDELESLKKELEELKEKQESEAKKAQSLAEATARFKAILKSVASDVSLDDLEELTTDITETIGDITQEITPPAIIGGVPQVEVESTKATIKWRTNKASNSIIALSAQADYDPKNPNSYALQVGQSQEEVKEHTVVIPDLRPSTVYHFQIRSKATVGPEGKSRDFVFETKPELPVIVSYSFKKITENSITVVWQTNMPSTSEVRYTPFINDELASKESKSQGNPSFVQSHEVSAVNLPSNVNFLIEISSKDVTGMEASKVIGTVRTAVDVKAPVISKVRSESTLFPGKVEKTQTIIYWETDEPSTSQIFWKEGVAKGDYVNSSRFDQEYTTSHVLVMTNFKPGAVYRFQVESIDPAGNKSRSTDYTVLTPKKGETVIDLIINNFQDIFGFLKKM